MRRLIKFSNGSLLVELLIAFGLGSIFLPVVAQGFISSRSGREVFEQRLTATMLVKEGVEALRSVREKDWNTFAVNGVYHPASSGGVWYLLPGSEEIDGFTRSLTIRDYSPSIKEIEIVVSWPGVIGRSISQTIYLGRYIGNDTFTQTTKAQFDLGTKNNTQVTNNFGGEVSLGAGGKADWCEPSLGAITPIDLPKSGVANGVTAIAGTVFAGTGDNASGVSFAKVNITNTDPPTGSVDATFDGYKTNGVFGDGRYAYLATDNNLKEVVIIDLENIVAGKYQEAGSFNAPGNGNGSSVFASGEYGYMSASSGNKFFNFNKPGQTLPLDADGVTIDGLGNKIYIVGNYAYVAVNSDTNQLNIIDLSNPTNLTKIKSFSLNGLEAKDVFVSSDGNRAYVVTGVSLSQKEFFIIDISNKSNPVVLGSYDTNGTNPKGVTIVPGNKAIIVGTGGTQQYQVVDLVNESNPVQCTGGGRSGGLSVSSGINGVSSVLEADGDSYSYIITGDSTGELKIIEGGPGGKYSTSGTFESSILDMGKSVSFNRFVANYLLPNFTETKFQFAVANPVDGSCQNSPYNFLGPDLTESTFYTVNSEIFSLPGQCFKYKVFLSTQDMASSPVFNDITINYSP